MTKRELDKEKVGNHVDCPECTRHIVRQPGYHPFFDRCSPSSPFIPSIANILLCGNRQVYLEATELLYSKNTFFFSPCAGSLNKFAAVLRPPVAGIIRHIEIDATCFRATAEGKMAEFLSILTKSFQLDTLTLPVLQNRRHAKPDPSIASMPMNWSWMLLGSGHLAPYFPRGNSEWLYATDVLFNYIHSGRVGCLKWTWKKIAYKNERLYEWFDTAGIPRFLKFLLKLLNWRVSRLDYPVESLEWFEEKLEDKGKGVETFTDYVKVKC